jgi:NADPH:quinone reductase-like Zn-dependent oxidoreductase
MVLAKPKELSWVEAAALPENWMTGKSCRVLVFVKSTDRQHTRL